MINSKKKYKNLKDLKNKLLLLRRSLMKKLLKQSLRTTQILYMTSLPAKYNQNINLVQGMTMKGSQNVPTSQTKEETKEVVLLH